MEELDLPLTQQEAASLYLCLDIAIDSLQHKKSILESIKALPKDKRPEELQEDEIIDGTINLNVNLTQEAKKLIKEVGSIIVELEKPKPTIIPKPKFK